jgi:hypothetical protein
MGPQTAKSTESSWACRLFATPHVENSPHVAKTHGTFSMDGRFAPSEVRRIRHWQRVSTQCTAYLRRFESPAWRCWRCVGCWSAVAKLRRGCPASIRRGVGFLHRPRRTRPSPHPISAAGRPQPLNVRPFRHHAPREQYLPRPRFRVRRRSSGHQPRAARPRRPRRSYRRELYKPCHGELVAANPPCCNCRRRG